MRSNPRLLTIARHASQLAKTYRSFPNPPISPPHATGTTPFACTGFPPLSLPHLSRQASSKSSKHSKSSKSSLSHPPATSSPAPPNESDDPFDFSPLQAGIKKAIARLKAELVNLRATSGFNLAALEGLKVELDKQGTTAPLTDLAQVMRKGGRSVVVLVGEKDHVKPIMSAILAHRELNVTPQVVSGAPLELLIPIPPPTKESRAEAVAAAGRVGEEAAGAIRAARQGARRKLKGLKDGKKVRPDDLRRAEKELEEVVRGGEKEVKTAVEGAKKGLEG
ncbi:MAG: hypothetical protein M1829_005211 [Trizodia sp. TS-e1964]|nr:MAG: hypothetical protein M1829_005211 [Trizodia sp. TS-e1964]